MKSKTLEELSIEIIDGDRGRNYPKQNEFSSHGYCLFLSTKNVPDMKFDFSECQFIDKKKDKILRSGKLKRGDIVFTTRGTIGNLAQYDNDVFHEHIRINSGMIIFRCLVGIDNYFFYSYIRNPEFKKQIKNFSSGTAQPQLPIRDMKKLQFSIPDETIQVKIGNFFRILDNKINNLEKQNKALAQITQTIFKSWFIDFDGVTEFEDSELGDVPKTWEIKSIRKVAVINELSIPKDFPYSEIEYIDISAVSEGKLLEVRKISLVDAPSRAKRVVRDYDIIWSTVRPNRKSYLLLNKPTPKMIVSTGFAVITPKSVPASFLYSYLTTEEFVNYLSFNVDGSAYPAVNPDRIAEYQIVVPPHQILQLYDNITKKIFDQIWNNNILLKKISKIRDSLLPKLMSGEIQVKN